jgi:hypothetical protein
MRTVKYSLSAAIALGFVCLTGNVSAATVSYNFSQGGWTDAAGDTGTLTGTFAGTAEVNGELKLADLTSLQADFQLTTRNGNDNFIFNLPVTTDFLFDPNSGLFNLASGSASSGIQLCSGEDTGAVCFNIPPNSGAATAASGFFDDLPNFGQTTTRQGISVTPQASAVPEPGNAGMLAAAGGVLLGLGLFRRRASA